MCEDKVETREKIKEVVGKIASNAMVFKLMTNGSDPDYIQLLSTETRNLETGMIVFWTELGITPEGLITKRWYAPPIEKDETERTQISLDQAIEMFGKKEIQEALVARLKLCIEASVTREQQRRAEIVQIKITREDLEQMLRKL